MDASFNSGRDSGSESDPGRSSRKRAISLTPRVDGLEDRQLLSHIAVPRQVRIQRQRAIAAQKAKLRAAKLIVPAVPAPIQATPATITDNRYSAPSIPALGMTSFNPIVRLLGTGTIGIKITRPNIPSNVLPPVVTAAPTTPAPTTPAVVTPTTPTAPAATDTPASTTPAAPSTPDPLDVAIQDAFTKLQNDSQAMFDKSQVTPVMLSNLRKDYQAIDTAAKSPADPLKIQALKDDFKAVGDVLPTQVQMAQIKLDVAALIGSRGVTDSALVDKTITDAEAVFNASNFTADDLKTLADDGAAIRTAITAKQGQVAATNSTATTISDLIASTAPATLPSIDTMPKVMEGILTGLYGPLMGLSSVNTLTNGPGIGTGTKPVGSMPALPPVDVAGTLTPVPGAGGKIDMSRVYPVLV